MVYSADSTSWTVASRNGRIDTPFGKFSTRPRDKNSLLGHRLSGEIRKFVDSLGISRFELEKLHQDARLRDEVNLAYLSFFEKHYAYQGWMKLEQKFIPVDEFRSRGKLNLDNLRRFVSKVRQACHP